MDTISTLCEYSDSMVIDCWSHFIVQQLGLNFWSEEGVSTTVLEAGILTRVQPQDRKADLTFHNHLNHTVSVCRCMGLGKALSQLQQFARKHRKKSYLHHIIFPYRLNGVQVVLGVLDIRFEDQLNCHISLYNPTPDSRTYFPQPFLKAVQDLLNKYFYSVNCILLDVVPCLNQQNDCSSCGAITAENGKFFFSPKYLPVLKLKYPYGAKCLRKKHIDDLKSEKFYREQLCPGQRIDLYPKSIEYCQFYHSFWETVIPECSESVKSQILELIDGMEERNIMDTAVKVKNHLKSMTSLNTSTETSSSSTSSSSWLTSSSSPILTKVLGTLFEPGEIGLLLFKGDMLPTFFTLLNDYREFRETFNFRAQEVDRQNNKDNKSNGKSGGVVKQHTNVKTLTQIVDVKSSTINEKIGEKLSYHLEQYSNNHKASSPNKRAAGKKGSDKNYEEKFRDNRTKIIGGFDISNDRKTLEACFYHMERGIGSATLDMFGFALYPIRLIANEVTKATAWGNLKKFLPFAASQCVGYLLEDETQRENVIEAYQSIATGRNSDVTLQNPDIPLHEKVSQILTKSAPEFAAIVMAHMTAHTNNKLDSKFRKTLFDFSKNQCTPFVITNLTLNYETCHYVTSWDIDFITVQYRKMKGIHALVQTGVKLTKEEFNLVKDCLYPVEKSLDFFIASAMPPKNYYGTTHVIPKLTLFTDPTKAYKQMLSKRDFETIKNHLVESFLYDHRKTLMRFLLIAVVCNGQTIPSEYYTDIIEGIKYNLDQNRKSIRKLAFLLLLYFTINIQFLKRDKITDIVKQVLDPKKVKNMGNYKEKLERKLHFRNLALQVAIMYLKKKPNTEICNEIESVLSSMFSHLQEMALYVFRIYTTNHPSCDLNLGLKNLDSIKSHQKSSNTKVRMAALYAMSSIVSIVNNYFPELKEHVTSNAMENGIQDNDPVVRKLNCHSFASIAKHSIISKTAMNNLIDVIFEKADIKESDAYIAKMHALDAIAHSVRRICMNSNAVGSKFNADFVKLLFLKLPKDANTDFERQQYSREFIEQVTFVLVQISRLFTEQKLSLSVLPKIRQVFTENLFRVEEVLKPEVISKTILPNKNSNVLDWIVRVLYNSADGGLAIEPSISRFLVYQYRDHRIQDEALKFLGKVAVQPKHQFCNQTLQILADEIRTSEEKFKKNIREIFRRFIKSRPPDYVLFFPVMDQLEKYLHSDIIAVVIETTIIMKTATKRLHINCFSSKLVSQLFVLMKNSPGTLRQLVSKALCSLTKRASCDIPDVGELLNITGVQSDVIEILANVCSKNQAVLSSFNSDNYSTLFSIFKEKSSERTDATCKLNILKILSLEVTKIKLDWLKFILNVLHSEYNEETQLCILDILQKVVHVRSASSSQSLCADKIAISIVQALLPIFNNIAGEPALMVEIIRVLHQLKTLVSKKATTDVFVRLADFQAKSLNQDITRMCEQILDEFFRNHFKIPDKVAAVVEIDKLAEKLTDSLDHGSMESCINRISTKNMVTIKYIRNLAKLTTSAVSGYVLSVLLKAMTKFKSKVDDTVVDNVVKAIAISPEISVEILHVAFIHDTTLPDKVKEQIEQVFINNQGKSLKILSAYTAIILNDFPPSAKGVETLLRITKDENNEILAKVIPALSKARNALSEKGQQEVVSDCAAHIASASEETQKAIISFIQAVPEGLLDQGANKFVEQLFHTRKLEMEFSQNNTIHTVQKDIEIVLELQMQFKGHVLLTTFQKIIIPALLSHSEHLQQTVLEFLCVVSEQKKVVFQRNVVEAIGHHISTHPELTLKLLDQICQYQPDALHWINANHVQLLLHNSSVIEQAWDLAKKIFNSQWKWSGKAYSKAVELVFGNPLLQSQSALEGLIHHLLLGVSSTFKAVLLTLNPPPKVAETFLFFVEQHQNQDLFVKLMKQTNNEKELLDNARFLWLMSVIWNKYGEVHCRNNLIHIHELCHVLEHYDVPLLKVVHSVIVKANFQNEVTKLVEFFWLVNHCKLELDDICQVVVHNNSNIHQINIRIARQVLNIPTTIAKQMYTLGWTLVDCLKLQVILAKNNQNNESETTEALNILVQFITTYSVGYKFRLVVEHYISTKLGISWLRDLSKHFHQQHYFEPNTHSLSGDQLLEEFKATNEGVTLDLPDLWKNLLVDPKQYHCLCQDGTFKVRSNLKPVQEWNAEQIKEWRTKFARNEKNLDTFIYEIFAVINRAVFLHTNSEKSKGYNLRLSQMFAIMTFLRKYQEKGRLAEISTGEGKSATIAAFAVINCLLGKKVDIITSSIVLAIRDAQEYKKFYSLFGLECADNADDYYSGTGPKASYTKDIVYGDANNFQYDYLKHHFMLLGTRADRGFDCIIIDEVDSMLVDEGSNIAMLSSSVPLMSYLNAQQFLIWKEVQAGEENVDVIVQKVNEAKAKEKPILPKHLKQFSKQKLRTWAFSALQAKHDIELGQDYRIEKGQLLPVDFLNSGVTYNDSRWGDGLHVFLEMKHQLHVRPETLITNYCSNVSYFTKYIQKENDTVTANSIYGLSGTLGSGKTKHLLSELYDVDFVTIPRYAKRQFLEYPAVLFQDNESWEEYILQTVKMETEKHRAVLLICLSEKEAEQIYKVIEKVKNIQIKKYIHSDNSGAVNATLTAADVIVATNLAGRGTDLKFTDYVKDHGGLHVCVTFLPFNRRVELQALGRASREGKPGTAQIVAKVGNGIPTEIKAAKELRDIREVEIIDDFLTNIHPEHDRRQNFFNQYSATRKKLIDAEEAASHSVTVTKTFENFFHSTVKPSLDFFKLHQHDEQPLFKQEFWKIVQHYKLRAMDEQWGLWLATQSGLSFAELLDKLEKNFTDVFLIVENPVYLIGLANEMVGFFESWQSIGEGLGKWQEFAKITAQYLEKAIELDANVTFSARYMLAFQYIRLASKLEGVICKFSSFFKFVDYRAERKQLIEKAKENLIQCKAVINDIEIHHLRFLRQLYEECDVKFKPQEKDGQISKEQEVSDLFLSNVEMETIFINMINNIDYNIKAIEDGMKLVNVLPANYVKGDPHPCFRQMRDKAITFVKGLSSTVVDITFYSLREERDMHFKELRGEVRNIISLSSKTKPPKYSLAFASLMSISKAVILIPQNRLENIKADPDSWAPWGKFKQKMDNVKREIDNSVSTLVHKLKGVETTRVTISFHSEMDNSIPKEKINDVIAKYYLETEIFPYYLETEISPNHFTIKNMHQKLALKVLEALHEFRKVVTVQVSFQNINSTSLDQILYLNMDHFKDACLTVHSVSTMQALKYLESEEIVAEKYLKPAIEPVDKYLYQHTNEMEIQNLKNSELRYCYWISEKKPFKIATFCTLAATALIQGGIGIGLILSGVGSPIAMQFFGEMITDVAGMISVATGTFDMGLWVTMKLVSYCTFGVCQMISNGLTPAASQIMAAETTIGNTVDDVMVKVVSSNAGNSIASTTGNVSMSAAKNAAFTTTKIMATPSVGQNLVTSVTGYVAKTVAGTAVSSVGTYALNILAKNYEENVIESSKSNANKAVIDSIIDNEESIRWVLSVGKLCNMDTRTELIRSLGEISTDIVSDFIEMITPKLDKLVSQYDFNFVLNHFVISGQKSDEAVRKTTEDLAAIQVKYKATSVLTSKTIINLNVIFEFSKHPKSEEHPIVFRTSMIPELTILNRSDIFRETSKIAEEFSKDRRIELFEFEKILTDQLIQNISANLLVNNPIIRFGLNNVSCIAGAVTSLGVGTLFPEFGSNTGLIDQFKNIAADFKNKNTSDAFKRILLLAKECNLDVGLVHSFLQDGSAEQITNFVASAQAHGRALRTKKKKTFPHYVLAATEDLISNFGKIAEKIPRKTTCMSSLWVSIGLAVEGLKLPLFERQNFRLVCSKIKKYTSNIDFILAVLRSPRIRSSIPKLCASEGIPYFHSILSIIAFFRFIDDHFSEGSLFDERGLNQIASALVDDVMITKICDLMIKYYTGVPFMELCTIGLNILNDNRWRSFLEEKQTKILELLVLHKGEEIQKILDSNHLEKDLLLKYWSDFIMNIKTFNKIGNALKDSNNTKGFLHFIDFLENCPSFKNYISSNTLFFQKILRDIFPNNIFQNDDVEFIAKDFIRLLPEIKYVLIAIDERTYSALFFSVGQLFIKMNKVATLSTLPSLIASYFQLNQ